MLQGAAQAQDACGLASADLAQGIAASAASVPVDPAPAGSVASPIHPPLSVEHVRVRADRIEATVRVADPRYRMTDASLARRVLARCPSLAHHACRNDEGPLFSAVMDHTSVPHLLEHLVIDAQTRAARDVHRVFVGTTQWCADGGALALVSASFEDDLTALSALRDAVSRLNDDLIALRG